MKQKIWTFLRSSQRSLWPKYAESSHPFLTIKTTINWVFFSAFVLKASSAPDFLSLSLSLSLCLSQSISLCITLFFSYSLSVNIISICLFLSVWEPKLQLKTEGIKNVNLKAFPSKWHLVCFSLIKSPEHKAAVCRIHYTHILCVCVCVFECVFVCVWVCVCVSACFGHNKIDDHILPPLDYN